MGRRTRRSNAKRAQARQNGVYGVQQAEIVAIPTTNNAIEPEEDADLSFFGDWWETNGAQHMKTKRLRPFVYTGDSDRTMRRKHAENSQALILCPMKTISSYFVSTCPKDTAQLQAQVPASLSAGECVIKLDNLYDQTKTLAGATFIQICVLLKFFELRVIGSSRRQTATTAALGMPTKLNRHSRTIQFWARHFESNGILPVFHRGKHQKTKSLMHDEDFMTKCGEWLHVQSPSQWSPERFQRHLNNDVIPLLTGAVVANVSESTARRWMQHVGYRYGLWKKNVYTDGHERDDVKSYRETFCKSFHGFATSMRYYCGDDMTTVEHLSTTNESEIVWVMHDESVFYANDDGGKDWSQTDNHDLHINGRGRSIMVSDFLCPCHGRLYNMVNGVKKYTTQTLHVGNNNEGYWTCEHMIKQVQEEVVAAFNEMHPGAKGHFTFDQSTNHAAFAPDALRASNMSLKPGGAQALLRPGRLLDGTTQSMVFEENHTRSGEAKGLQQVLLERGYDVKLLKMSLFCKQTHLDTCQGDVRMCCARHCMASQEDFRAQLSLLEETIIRAGHICAFLPKYHCELNPIESFWGAAKRYARSHCDYSFEGLKP